VNFLLSYFSVISIYYRVLTVPHTMRVEGSNIPDIIEIVSANASNIGVLIAVQWVLHIARITETCFVVQDIGIKWWIEALHKCKRTLRDILQYFLLALHIVIVEIESRAGAGSWGYESGGQLPAPSPL
jgi:hypothetical protein